MPLGYLVVQVSTSDAAIPINDASISVVGKDGVSEDSLLAFRLTNSSGKTNPIALYAPDKILSQSPGTTTPYSTYDLRISHPLYYTVLVNDVQIFDDITSLQNVKLIPLAEQADRDYQPETFTVKSQNL